MQIRNNYSSYQNHSYEQSHTHHITNCQHEEKSKKWEGELGSAEKDGGALSREQQRQNAMELSSLVQFESKKADERKRGVNLVKGFWDSLGEENGSSNGASFSVKENILSNLQGVIQNAGVAIQGVLQQKLLQKLTGIPMRIKAEIATALKKFGKGKEAFTALSDERTPSGQSGSHAQKEKKKEQEIPVARPVNNHLMDSYSKTGAYCTINENLTYQKPKAEKQDHKKAES